MKILFDIGHPAHVHQFKNTIIGLKKRGHEIKITARDKEVTLELLNKLGLEYTIVGKYPKNIIKKLLMAPIIDLELYDVAKKFDPDLMIGGTGNIYIAHAALFLNKKSILFYDTEHAFLQNIFSYPFVSSIVTPECYENEVGKKQIKYNGNHELAYLHPNYFTPNNKVLQEMGLKDNDKFIILRFVSWGASHDIGQSGISDKIGLVKELERYGRILITSEGTLPNDLKQYQIRVSPEKLHDLLYYATLYIGDGGTTASEAAVLGTPAVFISTIFCGYQRDEEKYGLLFIFSDPISGENEGIKKAISLLNDPDLKNKARGNLIQLLEDKIDVTKFMIWFIENYPDSDILIKKDPSHLYSEKYCENMEK